MEFEQTFRKCSVVESGSFEKCIYYGFVITFFHQPRNIFSGCTLTSYIQVVIESKILDSVEECLLKLCSCLLYTSYCRFGKKTVIADYLVALDAVAEFLDFACGSDDTMIPFSE